MTTAPSNLLPQSQPLSKQPPSTSGQQAAGATATPRVVTTMGGVPMPVGPMPSYPKMPPGGQYHR